MKKHLFFILIFISCFISAQKLSLKENTELLGERTVINELVKIQDSYFGFNSYNDIIYKSDDKGKTWTKKFQGDYNSIGILNNKDVLLYTSRYDNFYVSYDKGENFIQVKNNKYVKDANVVKLLENNRIIISSRENNTESFFYMDNFSGEWIRAQINTDATKIGIYNFAFKNNLEGKAFIYANNKHWIYSTKDGGVTWNAQREIEKPNNYVSISSKIFYTNQLTALYISKNEIYTSKDDGNSWKITPLPEIGLDRQIILKGDTFYVYQQYKNQADNYLYKFVEDGQNLEKMKLPYPVSYLFIDNNEYLGVYEGQSMLSYDLKNWEIYSKLIYINYLNKTDHLDIFSDEEIWGQDANLQPTLYNFKTKESIDFPAPIEISYHSIGLDFINKNVGYFVVNQFVDFSIFKTENGGKNWNLVYNNPAIFHADGFSKIKFIDENLGFVSTFSNGKYLNIVTKDGGKNWEIRDIPEEMQYGTYLDLETIWWYDYASRNVNITYDEGKTKETLFTIPTEETNSHKYVDKTGLIIYLYQINEIPYIKTSTDFGKNFVSAQYDYPSYGNFAVTLYKDFIVAIVNGEVLASADKGILWFPMFGLSKNEKENILKNWRNFQILNEKLYLVNQDYNLYQFDLTTLAVNDINNQKVGKVVLAPNPTNGELNLISEQSNKIQEIVVYDTTGKIVLEFNQLNTNHFSQTIQLPKGIYFIKVKTQKGIAQHQLIKK
ncbi:T9SS type A sorting domain-containing protein [Algoriella sp.]|uniref:T9SS type A sorting domain-containing protein n=1 Tax=Algoriella sp. TaxID=1872434 RepID=UPI002FC8D3EE